MRWDRLLRNLRLTPVLAAALLAACQERLAAPADCPDLCPGGYVIQDTILSAVADGDTSFAGYLVAGQGGQLRVSWQFPVSEDRALIQFVARPDSLVVGDSTAPYTIDSVAVEVALVYRDTAVTGLKLYLYRLPATVDTTTTFVDVDTAFTQANIVDSFVVDTGVAQRLRAVFSGANLARVAIPPGDSGVLALGVQIRADQGTGVRIGSPAGGASAPVFSTYVQLPNSDTTTVPRLITRTARFATFLSESSPMPDPSVLTIGGVPSSRAVLRFPWPTYLRDSAQLIRGTLELVLTTPIEGIPGDTARVQARPVLADFGAKSPTTNDGNFIGIAAVVPGQTDTVRFEVRRALTAWQGSSPRPSTFILQLSPEVGTFTRPIFGSTRTVGAQPRLRVTYARTFPFEAP